MPLSIDLFAQARHLATRDETKPQQANLRRAVSAAYYALFHEIVDRSARAVLGGADANGPIGSRLRRTIRHESIAMAAKWFDPRVQCPHFVKAMRAPGAGPTDLRLELVCRRVVELREERHRADYDTFVSFRRSDAIRHVTDAEVAVHNLGELPAADDTLIFLLGCVMGDQLAKNTR